MKDDDMLIKLSKEEKKLFKKTAENSGLSLSAWVRFTLLASIKKGEIK